MKRLHGLFLAASILILSSPARGQDEVRFRLEAPAQVGAGERFAATLKASVKQGWHLYSMSQPAGGPIPTAVTLQEDQVFLPDGKVKEPAPQEWFDQNFGINTEYHEGEVGFDIPVRVPPDAPAGSRTLAVSVRFMVCSDTLCLPPQTREYEARVAVVAVEEAPAPAAAVAEAPPPEPASSVAAEPPAQIPSAPLSRAPAGQAALPSRTLAYISFAMSMGALALLTPCVFPMIPITVSYFTKREKTRRQAVGEGALYAAGIVLTFTLIGFTLTFLFGAGGINRLAASPMVNILIAVVFVTFALNLFGVLEIRLPSSWLTAIDRKSTAAGGVAGIMLMAVTFSLTSFTCTVPFVGTVMVAALHGDVLWSILGVAAFATVFAAPFFLLAIFPSWLQTLPKSGNWMNSVKIVMGFLELAAAVKFISNVDLVFQWEAITRPVFITVWLAIALVTVFYLLGHFRFPHEMATESVGAGRVLFAVFFLAVSFYLLRGLFGFPLGELDAYLPPRDYGRPASLAFYMGEGARQEEEEWLDDYQEGLAAAAQRQAPVFIDFTGYTCTNCRWMEANIFTLPEVRELFGKFVLVRLYTDGGAPEHEANLEFERSRFGTIALPLYALMSPQDEIIATFPGLTRNPGEFTDFLEQGLAWQRQFTADLSRGQP